MRQDRGSARPQHHRDAQGREPRYRVYRCALAKNGSPGRAQANVRGEEYRTLEALYTAGNPLDAPDAIQAPTVPHSQRLAARSKHSHWPCNAGVTGVCPDKIFVGNGRFRCYRRLFLHVPALACHGWRGRINLRCVPATLARRLTSSRSRCYICGPAMRWTVGKARPFTPTSFST